MADDGERDSLAERVHLLSLDKLRAGKGGYAAMLVRRGLLAGQKKIPAKFIWRVDATAIAFVRKNALFLGFLATSGRLGIGGDAGFFCQLLEMGRNEIGTIAIFFFRKNVNFIDQCLRQTD